MLLLDIFHVGQTIVEGGSSASSFSWLALASFGISGLSLALTFIGAYRNKRVELVAKRFDKLCIDPIDAGFKDLDKLFAEHGEHLALDYRKQIASKLTEVNLILVSLLSIYPKLNITSITDVNDGFSEHYFKSQEDSETQEATVGDYLADYLKTKNSVIDLLYKYILNEELTFKLNSKTLRHLWSSSV